MKPWNRSSYFSFSILFAPDSAPGLSVTGDAALDTAVMGRLGVEMETPAATGTETAEAKVAREAAEAKAAAQPKVAADDDASEDVTKTPEELAAETSAAEERAAKVTALVEGGKTAEEAEAEIAAEETAAADAVQTPELTPEVQTWHEAQMAAKDEELTAATAKAEEAAAKVTALEAQLQAAGTQPLAIAPIDPLFLIDDPAKLDVEANKLKGFSAWLQQNWDGVEAVEASADGKTKASPGYTAAQIRARYAEVQELRDEILPAARESIKARQVHEAQARKSYPELFDAKRPEFKVAENLLKLAPGLKAVLPNIHTVIGDALRGEKLRLAEEKARAAKKVTAPAKTTPPKVIKAGTQATVPGTQSKAPGKKTEVVDTDKFAKAMEGGATGRAALVAAMS